MLRPLYQFQIFNLVENLKREVNIELEVHTHNDFGMATANAIVGVAAGADYVSNASSLDIYPHKAVVGGKIFSHESGIHVDGVIKNPSNYEAFSPEEVGLRRYLVIGKHSGAHAIHHKFEELGIDLVEEDCEKILTEIRKIVVETKVPPSDDELIKIAERLR